MWPISERAGVVSFANIIRTKIQYYYISITLELEHNVVIHSDDADYSDRSDGGLGTSGESSGGSDEIDGQTSRKIRIVIIATIVTCSLLVLVVTAILGKILTFGLFC